MSATTDKELADLLRWFDRQENVDAVYEEGDPDVGLFPCWIVALQWARNAKGLL